ncbi:MAG TPA: DUF4190 domain-containing protein [Anaerolineales bacterium]|nr:DUF4190 domain-containing protein [Anaerolineales bacterium]
MQTTSTRPMNTMAIVSLVCLVLTFCGCVGIAPIAGIITGYMGKKQVSENPMAFSDNSAQLAQIGFIGNIVILILSVCATCVGIAYNLYSSGAFNNMM